MAFLLLRPSWREVKTMISYVRDPKKTERRKHVTCLNCMAEDACSQFRETKRMWARISGLDKTAGYSCFHGIQSFGLGEVSAETAHEIGVKLAERLWGDRYEVVVATHCDKENVHNHFVLNSVSWRDGIKYKAGYEETRRLRREDGRLRLEYGLAPGGSVDKSRLSYAERTAEREGLPTTRGMIRADVDRAALDSLTDREFFRRLEEAGYEILLRDEDGNDLRNPKLRPPGAQRFFGFRGLGEGYALEEILERIAANLRREEPFPEEERENLRRYREKTQPGAWPSGLRGLYVRYCYELGILRKFPASVQRMPYSLRYDLLHLENLDAQTRFLGEKGIETMEDLRACREKAASKMESLRGERSDLMKEKHRAAAKADPERTSQIRERLAEIAAEMKGLRREVWLCDAVAQRSEQTRSELAALLEAQAGKEKTDDERVFGGRGGAGRADEPGRG